MRTLSRVIGRGCVKSNRVARPHASTSAKSGLWWMSVADSGSASFQLSICRECSVMRDCLVASAPIRPMRFTTSLCRCFLEGPANPVPGGPGRLGSSRTAHPNSSSGGRSLRPGPPTRGCKSFHRMIGAREESRIKFTALNFSPSRWCCENATARQSLHTLFDSRLHR